MEERLNSRSEKIHECANVLSNMQQIEKLLASIGCEDVRENSQSHLKNALIPAVCAVMHNDKGRGRLTADLARQISECTREIRKGVVERTKSLKLYDELSDMGKWPSEFKTELLWKPPWWLVSHL